MSRRRLAWPIAITVAIIAGAFAPLSPLVDAVSGADAAGVHLARPVGYVILAPLSDALDEFSLLSVPQLIAFGVSLIVVYVAFRLVLRRGRSVNAWCEFCYALDAFLLLALFVICAAVLPRPMAQLHSASADDVIFDVHSHTNYSHDARTTFTVAGNRAWHRDAGFHVAYITDHRCFDGAAEGMRGNPRTAGEGTVLLSGIELPPELKHLVLLERPDVDVPEGMLEAWCIRARRGKPATELPVMIQTIPENLSWLSEIGPMTVAGVKGIELSDGAPRGIAQAQRDRAFILAQASRLHFVPLAGSNNHGWGRTAIAWNVATIPGWRAMPPDSLDEHLRARLLTGAPDAARVIARRTPDGSHAVALTLPAVLVTIARTITFHERVWWLVWTWLLWAVLPLIPRRKWSTRGV